MSTFIKGDAIILSVKDGDAYRPIACLTSNSLSRTKNVMEAQTKCAPGQILRQGGSQSYELSFEGNYIDTTTAITGEVTKASHDFLMGVMDGTTNSTWRMDTGISGTLFYYGTAILSDLSADFAAGDEFATFSGTMSGSGLIVTVEPV